MAKKPGERVARLFAEVEKSAKKLRGEVSKRAKAAPMLKALLRAAERLRERAAMAARHMEKYVHEIRVDLENERSPRHAPPRRKARATRVRRKRALAAG